MGADIPKQFLEISGKPVIIHTISRFKGKVDKMIIACHKDYVNLAKKLTGKYFDFDIDVVSGGADRMESVYNALKRLISVGVADDDIVLTHDGVRPFVTEKMIDDSIKNIREGHFCTVAINSTDTVCVSADGENIDAVPKRKEIYNIQTPQTFTVGGLMRMIENCKGAGEYTDLCGLALAMGESVKIVEGSSDNIKITVPADIAVAEAILERDGQL